MTPAALARRVRRRPRMLVVEDELVLGDALGAWFEASGFEVARAKTLAEARIQLAGAPFHATVLDVRLPDGDGLSLLGSARPSRTVVISATPDEDRYSRLGVLHHLAKPVELCALERLVCDIAAETNAAWSRSAPAEAEPCRRSRQARAC